MRYKNYAVSMLLTLVTAGAVTASAGQDTHEPLRLGLEHIVRQRIFFGHQSVGVNLLDGLQVLASTAGIPLRIEEAPTASNVRAGGIGHSFMAENRNPVGKLQSFYRAISMQASELDIAILKLCYLDFTAKTDVKALFTQYHTTMNDLCSRNPGVAIVHATTPLTSIQLGPKVFLKGLLGRAPYGLLENLRREEYNDLLRQTYTGRAPIFDLARLESTTPNGKQTVATWKGRLVPELAPIYTDDGGHLNATGQLRVAREFVAVLATIPER